MMAIYSTLGALDSIGHFGFHVLHRIHAKNPKEVTKYLESKYTMMEAHNIFARVRHLMADPILNPVLTESIDTDLHRISIAAGK